MPVKTRGTKTSPWGLFSSQRLPLILLAMLTLYRMCIKPNKSFHLLCLIHKSSDHFSKCFSHTTSQLVSCCFLRPPIVYFFQNAMRLFFSQKGNENVPKHYCHRRTGSISLAFLPDIFPAFYS